jgi:hypothetical protein
MCAPFPPARPRHRCPALPDRCRPAPPRVVYEALLTEARRSSLNVRPDGSRNTVPAFVEALRPYINMDLLRHANRATPAPGSGGGGGGGGAAAAAAKL